MRILSVLLIATAAGQASWAQEPKPSVFQAGTRVVEMTITATRAGNKPVDDLRATDVRVFDNDKEQVITSFEKFGQGDGLANHRPQRLSIILLDALNTAWSDQIYGREGVARMLRKLPPGDRIAIFALGDTLHLLHDFSTDYASLRTAVENYTGEQPANWAGNLGKGPIIGLATSAAFSEKNRILDTLQALTGIAQITKSYSGQKSLLWVSAGFPTQFKIPLGGGVGDEYFHSEVAQASRKLAAANVALYPIHPGGLTAAFDVERTGSLEEMAEPTGGRAFYGSNDISALVRAAMEDARQGYVLTFTPSDYLEDGSFHDLRLKTSRKGLDIRYRSGYVADSSMK